ncbi:MAG: tRNA pseudouridine(38-40) synthase TruA [Balneolaceae bacterium]|nr:tRNA pseudouridine(38-40) synthase TruA [Balneolaceae bacterium]
MSRYSLIIEYNGEPFSGWQIQPDAITVEGELEKAFAKILQQPVDLIGQGRTDAGVHANGQVAHVDLPDDVDMYKLLHGVNSLAGKDVFIKTYEKVEDEFHARFDALTRSYSYRVAKYPRPLFNHISWFPGEIKEPIVLNECAALLLGEHDFNGFSKYNEENFTTLSTIENARWKETGEAFVFEITANRFLRNMVRRLVGTSVAVAQGNYTVKDFKKMLDLEAVAKASKSAPAKGLILEKVSYKKT